MVHAESASTSDLGGDGTSQQHADPTGASAASISLAARIGEFADTLPEQDRRVLAAVLLRAMDPVAARWWQPTDDLGPDELALLSRLERRKPGTDRDQE